MKFTKVIVAAAVGVGIAFTPTPTASAEPAVACVTDSGFWIFKGTKRTICDGAKRPDGSWLRNREFWTPSYWKPFSCSTYGGSSYSTTTCDGGYRVPQRTNGVEDYIVFDYNVLPDEPGWLG